MTPMVSPGRRASGSRPSFFQQHQAFPGGLFGQGQVFGGLHIQPAQGVVLGLVKQAQHKAGGEQPHAGPGDEPGVQHTLGHRAEDLLVGAAAVQVAAVFQRQADRFLRPGGDLVVAVEVRHRPAVRDEMPGKAPVPAQDLLQSGAGAADFAVGAVVGAHDRLHPAFPHAGFKGGQVGFLHIPGGGPGVKAVAQRLRPRVDRKMLGAGGGQQVLPLPLDAPDEAHRQPGGEGGVLAVGFLAAAPAGVPEDVHVGRPEGQPLVDVPVAAGAGLVVLGPAFQPDHPADPLHQFRVEGGPQPDGLGEHGGHPRPGHAVQRFVPPVVGRHPQPGDGRRVVPQLGSLLLQRHLFHQRPGAGLGLRSVHHRHSLAAAAAGAPRRFSSV